MCYLQGRRQTLRRSRRARGGARGGAGARAHAPCTPHPLLPGSGRTRQVSHVPRPRGGGGLLREAAAASSGPSGWLGVPSGERDSSQGPRKLQRLPSRRRAGDPPAAAGAACNSRVNRPESASYLTLSGRFTRESQAAAAAGESPARRLGSPCSFLGPWLGVPLPCGGAPARARGSCRGARPPPLLPLPRFSGER